LNNAYARITNTYGKKESDAKRYGTAVSRILSASAYLNEILPPQNKVNISDGEALLHEVKQGDWAVSESSVQKVIGFYESVRRAYGAALLEVALRNRSRSVPQLQGSELARYQLDRLESDLAASRARLEGMTGPADGERREYEQEHHDMLQEQIRGFEKIIAAGAKNMTDQSGQPAGSASTEEDPAMKAVTKDPGRKTLTATTVGRHRRFDRWMAGWLKAGGPGRSLRKFVEIGLGNTGMGETPNFFDWFDVLLQAGSAGEIDSDFLLAGLDINEEVIGYDKAQIEK